MLEKDIVDRVESHFASLSKNIFREVPFLQRYVDVVGYDEYLEEIVAIEAKIKNWHIALQQARTCLLFSDQVYIAMPDEFVHRVDEEILSNLGIGLLAVGQNVNTLLEPGPPLYKHEYHAEWMISLLNRMNSDRRRRVIDD